MNLAIDIGNSSVKIGRFDGEELEHPILNTSVESLAAEINNLNPDRIIVSSVGEAAPQDQDNDFAKKYMTIFLQQDTPLPITIDYETPDTLGVDRIAAVTGASVLNPDGDSLVIDLGSCCTYDIIENGKIFKGGIISPGMGLRFKSMYHFTRNLPLLSHSTGDVSFLGSSTDGAMKSGVINGMISEMESFIGSYKDLYPKIQVFMCGGESKIFENRLKASIFVIPELVLVGLNRILVYNIGDEIIF